ncbi:MAG: serine/threonine protein kinase [Myxococcales bacterium]|nr:serine/threonine protein kinase [Myxococcales bacterium]MCB9707518.1 serine/threonine protein kinase [Myxococcales bacterium]
MHAESDNERTELRGTVLDGRYRMGACIGMGGTGLVFEARDLELGREVALKMLQRRFASNPDLCRRLRREGQVARTVSHPSVVAIYDQGLMSDGSPYAVMERVTGECLARVFSRYQTLSPQEVAALGIRVAAVLHRVHRLGYTHRDLKPEHVLLQRHSNGELRVQLLDFGVCASLTMSPEERRLENGRVYGTPHYVSPEQAAGNPYVDGRADLYSLGVILFQGLTGRLPFNGNHVPTLLSRIMLEDAPRVGLIAQHIDRDMDAIIARALARKREDRFQNARAIARALSYHVLDRREVESTIASKLVMSHESYDQSPTMQDLRARREAAA